MKLYYIGPKSQLPTYIDKDPDEPGVLNWLYFEIARSPHVNFFYVVETTNIF